MLGLRVCATLWALTQLVSFAAGTCDVPPEWQKATWFSHYDNGMTWVVNYSGSVYLYSLTNIREVVTAGFSCLHSEEADRDHHQLLLQNDRRRYCLRAARAGPALLVLFTRVPSTVTDAGQCAGRLQDSEISWQVGYPVSRSRERCPFSSGGVYQAVVTKDGQAHCEQDAGSVLTVDGSGELLINSCSKNNTYGYPLRGARLQCVAHAPGTGGLGGGDPLLLLSYHDGQVTRFYCARYSVTDDTVYLSLDTASPDKASCRQGMAATTSRQGHLALTLTAIQTCQPNPCAHGGECVPRGTGVQCMCRSPYRGPRCEAGGGPVALTGSSGPSTLVIVLVTLSGGVVVAALAIGVVVCQRRLKKKESSLPENIDGELPKQSSSMQAEPKDLDD